MDQAHGYCIWLLSSWLLWLGSALKEWSGVSKKPGILIFGIITILAVIVVGYGNSLHN